MEETGRIHDATLVRIRQPDRTGGAALPVAHEIDACAHSTARTEGTETYSEQLFFSRR